MSVNKAIAELESRFPGWRVWVTPNGSPVATRRGKISPVNRARWQYTLFCDSWPQLQAQLAEQQDIDDRLPGGTRFAV
jgi:hypothetical protein